MFFTTVHCDTSWLDCCFLVRPLKVYVCNTTTHKHVDHCEYTLTYTYSHTCACDSEISSSAVNKEIKDSTSTREYITNLASLLYVKIKIMKLGCRLAVI